MNRDTICSSCLKWTHRLTDGTQHTFCDWLCEKRFKIKHGILEPSSYRELDEGERIQVGDYSFYENGSKTRLREDFVNLHLNASGGKTKCCYHYSRLWTNSNIGYKTKMKIFRPSYE